MVLLLALQRDTDLRTLELVLRLPWSSPQTLISLADIFRLRLSAALGTAVQMSLLEAERQSFASAVSSF